MPSMVETWFLWDWWLSDKWVKWPQLLEQTIVGACHAILRLGKVNLGFVQHLHFQNFGAGGSQGSRNTAAGTQGKRPAIQPWTVWNCDDQYGLAQFTCLAHTKCRYCMMNETSWGSKKAQRVSISWRSSQILNSYECSGLTFAKTQRPSRPSMNFELHPKCSSNWEVLRFKKVTCLKCTYKQLSWNGKKHASDFSYKHKSKFLWIQPLFVEESDSSCKQLQ